MQYNNKRHNVGIQNLGKDIIFLYFEELFKISFFPIISVGCGLGLIEKEIMETFQCKYHEMLKIPNDCDLNVKETELFKYKPMFQYKNNEFILVDPILKNSTNNYIFNFNTCDELSETLINNNVIFLNWPSPNFCKYDIESILLMKPKHIICIYEKTGSSGGSQFLKWLKYCGIDTDVKMDTSVLNYPLYHEVNSTTRYINNDYLGSFEYTITWLSKNKMDSKKNIPLTIGEKIIRKPFDSMMFLALFLLNKNSNFST